MNADGTDFHAITHLYDRIVSKSDATMSPDGQKIALTISDDTGQSYISTAPLDGSGFQFLTEGVTFRPVWSPDGKLIMYSLYRLLSGTQPDLQPGLWHDLDRFTEWATLADLRLETWIMNADGSNQHRLLESDSHVYGYAWHPTGEQVLLRIADRAWISNDFYQVNIDGSNLINISQNPYTDNEASWSPDGSKIVFVSNRSGKYDLYIMNSDGTGEVQLTATPEHESMPAWSPDGQYIAYKYRGYVHILEVSTGLDVWSTP